MSRTSLKLHHTCPICDGVEVLRIKQARQHTEWDESSKQNILPVAKVGDRGIGSYSVYICASCGYAEWFVDALDLDDLRELAQKHSGPGGPVALLLGPRQPNPGVPYR